MALISPADQQRLRAELAAMTRPVRLMFVTQTLECETCVPTRQILDELPELSDKITIEEINLLLDGDKARALGIDRAPGIAVLYEDDAGVRHDSRIRFVGMPAGYEFISLVHAVRLAGSGESQLDPATRDRLAAVDRPITMQVFTTPT
jgi:alkyl hydroperoxide reductase subunit AhpF